jgi:hypothetical protein
MKRPLLAGVFLSALVILLSGMAFADSGFLVNFPSNTTFYCSQTIPPCDFMSNHGGTSQYMWTTGDFVTETFFFSDAYVNDLTINWGVWDGYGGSPGTNYEHDIYINGVQVGFFLLPDCNYCGSLYTIFGTFNFAPIYGYGAYNISIVLAQTAAPGDGSEYFSVLTSNGSASTTVFSPTPEPSSMILLGSGILGLAGVVRRKLML